MHNPDLFVLPSAYSYVDILYGGERPCDLERCLNNYDPSPGRRFPFFLKPEDLLWLIRERLGWVDVSSIRDINAGLTKAMVRDPRKSDQVCLSVENFYPPRGEWGAYLYRRDVPVSGSCFEYKGYHLYRSALKKPILVLNDEIVSPDGFITNFLLRYGELPSRQPERISSPPQQSL